MAREINLIKTDIHGVKAFIPYSGKDAEEFAKIPEDKVQKASITQPRNAEFLAKYWVLCDWVISNLPEDFVFVTPQGDKLPIKTAKDVDFHLKMQAGLWSLKMSLGGKPIYEVGSISFAKMKEPEFEKFFGTAIDNVLKYFIKPPEGMKNYRQKLIDEVYNQFIARNRK